MVQSGYAAAVELNLGLLEGVAQLVHRCSA